MGVSFKVSKTGTRFRPKPSALSDSDVAVDGDNSGDGSRIARGDEPNVFKLEGSSGVEGGEKNSRLSGSFLSSAEQLPLTEGEVSFTLNLFLDGYSIGKPSENETAHQSTGQDVPKLLHPYDRASESLFSAIESGRLPSDILDDIPCKFTDGTLVCEVRDYRKCASEPGSGSSLSDGGPTTTKICLRMSLENVVKDIPMISDNSWTYGDLMELESRILKALQPQLHLEPTPKLDRLCKNPVSTKLDLGLCSLRRKRLRQAPEVVVTSNSKSHGKKICMDRVPDGSNGRLGDSGFSPGHVMAEHVQENLGNNNMLAMRANSFGPDLAQHLASNTPGYNVPGRGVSPSGQDMMNSYVDNSNPNAPINRKREIHDGPLSPLTSISKRQRPTNMLMGLEGMQQQPGGQHMESFRGSDLNWKNQLLQQQAMARGIQYANTGNQKFSQQVFEGALSQDPGSALFSAAGQQGMRFVPKEEQIEGAKLEGSDISGGMQMAETETAHLDPLQAKHQQRLPQNNNFTRPNFPQAAWNSLGQQHPEKDVRKEDQNQNQNQNQNQPPKRKTVQSPRLPAGSLVQSPLSSKSGEFSGGSAGTHFGAVANAGAVGVSQKEKVSVGMSPAAAATSLNSGDSMQRQHHQAQLAIKRRSNSIPKNQATGVGGSPVSFGNANAPLNAASPSVGTQPIDKDIVERFSKIEMVAMRHQLNRKKNRVDEPSRNPGVHLAHVLGESLSRPDNSDEFKDESETTLSKSLGGGSMNACKTKIITLVHQERVVQGNIVTFVPKFRTRMIMSEKANDGTVAMLYGEVDQSDFQTVEDHLPTLPNTHFADLLAKQFTTLMEREGYAVQQHLELRQPRINQSNLGAMLPNNPAAEMQQYGEAVSGQQPSNDVKPIISGNTALNPTQNLSRMLPPGTTQGLQMPQGLLPSSMAQRPQLPDSQSQLPQQQQNPLIQQQQSQHPQFQRSMMLSNNPLSNLSAIGQNPNVQLGNQMMSKQSALQLQLFQQQQQQGPQMQRKMMMGLGTAVGMGNVGGGGNTMVGIPGLNNAAARGIGGGAGISSPMAAIPGMGQSPMSMNPGGTNINTISQHLRSGTLAPAVLMASKLRMAQSRPGMLGGPQVAAAAAAAAGMAGISGAARQLQHPGSAGLSMLNQTLNRAGMNPMQRAPMGPMGPPKLMSGMNMYMNQQQQQQLQIQQLQQQHLQQQQLQQQQQQLQQLQQQHQETAAAAAASLQGVVSSPQVSSPSTIGIPQMNQQQQASPQQMSQRTPMSPQMSAGAIHALSAGNPDPCPASPQLSSQTLGSVGSITNSPMDLQVSGSRSLIEDEFRNNLSTATHQQIQNQDPPRNFQ